jgi:hypothetical protein
MKLLDMFAVVPTIAINAAETSACIALRDSLLFASLAETVARVTGQ